MGNPWGPWGTHGGPWGPWGTHGASWDPMGTPWGPWGPWAPPRVKFSHHRLGGPMGPMGNPWGPWGTHGAPWAPWAPPWGPRSAGFCFKARTSAMFFLIDFFRVPSVFLQISSNLGKFSRAATVVRTNRFPPLKNCSKMLSFLVGGPFRGSKSLGSCPDNLCGTKIQIYTAADPLGGPIDSPRGPTFQYICSFVVRVGRPPQTY